MLQLAQAYADLVSLALLLVMLAHARGPAKVRMFVRVSDERRRRRP